MATYSLYNAKWLDGNWYPHVVAYYFREWKDYHMQVHEHDQVEIMYVIAGTCVVEAMSKSHTMDKGDFIIIDAGIPHRLEVEKETPCRILNIEFIFRRNTTPCPSFRQLVYGIQSGSSFLKQQRPYFSCKDQGEIYTVLKNLITELDEKRTDYTFITQLLLSEILIKIFRMTQETTLQGSSVSSLHVKRALEYIHQHYDQDIRVADIASSIKIHEGYFHRIFKEHTGLTPIDYLTRLRVNKARMLLARTDIPIIEISNYVGINSRQYFTSIFKKHTGQTPSKYRRTIDKSEGFSDNNNTG
jgi:AraC-like DNA-binding protein